MNKDCTREIELAYERLLVKLLTALLADDKEAIIKLQAAAISLYKLREQAGHKYNLDIKVSLK